MTTVDARAPLALTGRWRGWIGLAVALAGIGVVLSPYLWSDAWTFSGFSLDYLSFYAWFWVPFAALGAFAAWRDGLSTFRVPSLTLLNGL